MREEEGPRELERGARPAGLVGRRIDAEVAQRRVGRRGRHHLLLEDREHLLELRGRAAAGGEERERRRGQRPQVGVRERRPHRAEAHLEGPVTAPPPHVRERVAHRVDAGGAGGGAVAVVAARRGGSAGAGARRAQRREEPAHRPRLGGHEGSARGDDGVALVEGRERLGEGHERRVQADRRAGSRRRDVRDLDVREGGVERADHVAAPLRQALELGHREAPRPYLGRVGGIGRGQHRDVDRVAVVALGVVVADGRVRGAREIFDERAGAEPVAEDAVDVVAERRRGDHRAGVGRAARRRRDDGGAEPQDAQSSLGRRGLPTRDPLVSKRTLSHLKQPLPAPQGRSKRPGTGRTD